MPSRAAGLIDGGVDAILIETCQDPLQIKAAVNGAKLRLRREAGSDIADLRAGDGGDHRHPASRPRYRRRIATIIHALDVPLIGLNCATGPQEMAEHVRYLVAQLARSDFRCCPMPACPSWSTAPPTIRSARHGNGELDGTLRRRGRAST